MHPGRWLIALSAAAALCGCDAAAWRPADVIYVSASLSPCAAVSERAAPCDPLAANARDSLLLAQIADRPITGTSALGELTSLAWTQLERRRGRLHVRFAASTELRTSYVLELLRVARARDTLLSIASNGGTVVWQDGGWLGASRTAARRARSGQDLYSVRLHPGVNRLLYRVVTQTAESQLHREWEPSSRFPALLAQSIALGAYTSLVAMPVLSDSARFVKLQEPQVRVHGQPRIRFRWLSMLGRPIAAAGDHQGAYPDSLPLPNGFPGMAVLETEVTDATDGHLLFLEQIPVFRSATAARLAHTLTASPHPPDPVREARVAAVRAAFGLGKGADTLPLPAWHQVHALADLYRSVQLPHDFQRFPGPQVWGYRAADGSVQPYWLIVPPGARSARAPVSAARAPGLEFSVTHMVNPNFWRGRGYTISWLEHMLALGQSSGNFGVLPHLRGRHDFGQLGVEEFRTITRQVAASFAIDTARIAWLVWSSHARPAVEIARHPEVPLAWLGIAVPALYQDEARLERELDSLRLVRPGLQWILWRAADDDQVPRARTQDWVRAIRRAGFIVEYRDVPFSTHLGGFFHDIEDELYRKVSPATRPPPAQPSGR